MTSYEKLVRDRIPEIIARNGKQCQVRILDNAEYAVRLQEKLAEELAEFQQDGEIEELADLVEVVQAIVESRGMDWVEFEQMREEKRLQRGGFRDRVFLLEVDEETS